MIAPPAWLKIAIKTGGKTHQTHQDGAGTALADTAVASMELSGASF
jgi:hypothetical protein